MKIQTLTGKKRNRVSPGGMYTLCFLAVSLCVFSWFFLNGKTMIWKETDGMTQHFNALVYYRSWLREILAKVFLEHSFEIPLWNWNVGYGADILTTFHYYVLGDPLNLLSVLVPADGMEGFYGGLIVLRIYLAGQAFLAYCRGRGETSLWSAGGVMIYSFGFWTIMAGVRHPFFLNPLIYFPLLLKGIDRVFQKGSPYLFIGMTALCAVSNFSFFYMICILMFFYAAGEYLALFRPYRMREFMAWFWKFVLYFAVGTALSAVILFPVALVMLTSGRAEAGHIVPVLYPALYYWKFPAAFLTGQAGYWNKMGYTAFGVLSVLQLFLKRKRGGSLKAGFLFLTVLLLIPWCGHALNGFSYVTNRFVWAYGLVTGYIFVKMAPELMALEKKEKIRLTVAAAVYCGFCFLNRETRTEFVLAAMVPLCFLLLFLVLAEKDWIRLHNRGVQAGMLLGLCGCLILQGSYKYSYTEQDYLAEFEDQGEAWKDLTENTPGSLVKEVPDDGVWRYDSGSAGEIYNNGLQLGEKRVNFYWSLADGTVNEFQRELYLNTQQDHRYDGLDGRMALEALAGVKYVLIPKGETSYLPYGYEQEVLTGAVGEEGEEREYSVYENPDSLPFAYVYSSYISSDSYEEMTAVQKQQALLQGAVMEEAPKSAELSEISPEFTERVLPYTVEAEEGIVWEDGKALVKEPGASVTLSFQGQEECETYLILEGLDYQDLRETELYSQEELAAMGTYDRNKLYAENRDWEGATSTVLTITSAETEKKLKYLTKENSFSTGVEDYLIHLGYSSQARTELTITFQKKGIYTFDSLQTVCQPVRPMEEWIQELKQEEVTRLELEGNQVEAAVSLENPGIVCFAVPYSAGWTAYVDGEKAKVIQTNTMNLGIELEAGEHEIQLRYHTPGLDAGAAVSLGGAVFLGILAVSEGKKRKRRRKS